MDLDQQLSHLAKQVSELQAQTAHEEGRLTALEDQRERITEACKALSVTPEKLDGVIITKEKELEALLGIIETGLSQIEQKREALIANTGTTTETG